MLYVLGLMGELDECDPCLHGPRGQIGKHQALTCFPTSCRCESEQAPAFTEQERCPGGVGIGLLPGNTSLKIRCV